MASNFVLMTDSGGDLPKRLVEELNVVEVPLTVSVDGGEYVSGDKLDIKDFYAQLREGKTATTSAINFDAATEAIEAQVKEGNDVLFIAFSSGLSSTYNTVKIAGEELSEKYPERKIYVVDTLCASLGEGLLVYYAAQKRSEGLDIDAVRAWVEDNKMNMAHWFTVDDLHHLKRGGRVSAATAVVGTMLAIKPVLHVDDEGHLVNVAKARGRKPSIQALCTKLLESASWDASEQSVFISHGDCEDEANYLADMIREKFSPKEIVVDYIGPVIGAHAGPGTIALFFMANER